MTWNDLCQVRTHLCLDIMQRENEMKKEDADDDDGKKVKH